MFILYLAIGHSYSIFQPITKPICLVRKIRETALYFPIPYKCYHDQHCWFA